MLTRPNEKSKLKAIQLAEQLSAKERNNDAIKKLIEELYVDASFNRELQEFETSSDDGIVGIYRPEERNGEVIYVRDKRLKDDFPFWADVEEIKPKKSNHKRIVLLGESVARGYFFEPEYSCAKLLDRVLKIEQQSFDFEVIDLARSNLLEKQLLETFEASFNLNPDAIVIFAGNNWFFNLFLTNEDMVEIALILKNGNSFTELKRVVEMRFENIIEDLLQKMGEMAMVRKVPIIFVIPEFNLKDWNAANVYEKAILWPQRNIFEVNQAVLSGEIALKENNHESVKLNSEKIIALSPTNPIGYELMAQYYLHHKEFLLAKDYFRKAKDSGIFRRGIMPRTFSITRKTILKIAPKYNVRIIDLAEVLDCHTADGIPDRTLFMDYCHLSFKGLEIAMRAVAKELSSVFDFETVNNDSAIRPDEEILAKAHFCAALHNAHFGPQRNHILEFHCSEAIRYSSSAIDWMILYMEVVTRKIPWDVNPSYIQLLKCNIFKSYEGGTQFIQAYSILDMELTNAMAKVIEQYRPGISQWLNELRVKEHLLVKGKRTNLLDTYYHLKSYRTFYTPKFYFQSFEHEASFHFFCNQDEDVSFDLTIRVPTQAGETLAKLFLNSIELDVINTSCEWRSVKIDISRRNLNNGLNHVGIEWPNMIKDTDELGLDDYQRVFGEIHSFHAYVKS